MGALQSKPTPSQELFAEIVDAQPLSHSSKFQSFQQSPLTNPLESLADTTPITVQTRHGGSLGHEVCLPFRLGIRPRRAQGSQTPGRDLSRVRIKA